MDESKFANSTIGLSASIRIWPARPQSLEEHFRKMRRLAALASSRQFGRE